MPFGGCRDMAPGSDTWAVAQRIVSVTPLTLRCDIPFGQVSMSWYLQDDIEMGPLPLNCPASSGMNENLLLCQLSQVHFDRRDLP